MLGQPEYGGVLYLVSVEGNVRRENDMVKLGQPAQKGVVAETTLGLVMKYVPELFNISLWKRAFGSWNMHLSYLIYHSERGAASLFFALENVKSDSPHLLGFESFDQGGQMDDLTTTDNWNGKIGRRTKFTLCWRAQRRLSFWQMPPRWSDGASACYDKNYSWVKYGLKKVLKTCFRKLQNVF